MIKLLTPDQVRINNTYGPGAEKIARFFIDLQPGRIGPACSTEVLGTILALLEGAIAPGTEELTDAQLVEASRGPLATYYLKRVVDRLEELTASKWPAVGQEVDVTVAVKHMLAEPDVVYRTALYQGDTFQAINDSQIIEKLPSGDTVNGGDGIYSVRSDGGLTRNGRPCYDGWMFIRYK